MPALCLAPGLARALAVLADADMEGLYAIGEAVALALAVGLLAAVVASLVCLGLLAAYVALVACYAGWAAAPLWRAARSARLPHPALSQACAVAVPCLQLAAILSNWAGLPAGLLCLIACSAGIASGIWVLVLLSRWPTGSELPHPTGAFASCTSLVVLHFLLLVFSVGSLLIG